MSSKTGVELIAEERQEQLEKHNTSIRNDIEANPHGELKKAAIFCLTGDVKYYPVTWALWFVEKIKTKNEIEKLKVAGALIAAEIDRLQNNNHE